MALTTTQILKRAQRVHSDKYFDVRVLFFSSVSEPGTVTIITPRRAGNAVARNTFKRRVRALFREQKLTIMGYHWVFFVKRATCSFAHIKEIIEKIVPELLLKSSSPA